MRESSEETICVRGHVGPDLPIGDETMHALPDPADPSQAILVNVPFFVDGLNFGDIIRLGEPEYDVYPIEAVVLPSGHVRFLLFLEDQPVTAFFERMEEAFPGNTIRMEHGGDGLVAISMHPDIDPDDVFEELIDWLAEHVPDDDEMWDRPAFCITEPITSRIGPLPARG